MQIEPWSLALQALNFLILAWLLHRFLYRPVLAMVARRQKAIDDAFADAKAREEAALAKDREYATRLAGTEAERERLLATAQSEAEAERIRLLDAARAEVEAELARGRGALAEERRAAEVGLAGQAIDLGIGVARRLLRQLDGESIDAGLLERLLASPEAAGIAARDAPGADRSITVATATPLDAATRLRFKSALRQRLGAPLEVSFTTDASLIAGAELRHQHAVVGLNWRDALAEARKEMVHHAGSG